MSDTAAWATEPESLNPTLDDPIPSRETWLPRWTPESRSRARDRMTDCRSGSHPDLPEDMIPEDWQPGCHALETLWHEVVKELTDNQFRNRTHGSRRTSEAGCNGPLCRKAVRDHSRRRFANGPSERYKYVDPILEFFREDAEKQIRYWELKMKRALSSGF